METIFESDSIKIEKEKAMRRYRTFQNIASIVRTLEIFFAIALFPVSISWTSSYIPTVLKFSDGIIRRISSLLFSPLFVFFVGNMIIITLFANSSPPSKENFGDSLPEIVDVDVDEIVNAAISDVSVIERAEERVVVEKVYRRSQSTAMVEVVKLDDVAEKKELRRSTTVPRRKIGSDNVAAKAAAEMRKRSEEDEMSNEEFNRRVEEFIEKQRKFLSEESKILVLSN